MIRYIPSILIAALPLAVRSLTPLLVYPLLTRTLGIDGFADFSAALSVGLVLAVFVEFGFGLMAVREFADEKTGDASAVVGILVFGRCICALFAAIIVLIMLDMTNIFSDPFMAAASLLVAVANGFGPSWYYIATEKFGSLAKIEIIVAIIVLLSTLLMVKNPEDELSAVICFAVPPLLFSMYGVFIVVAKYGCSLPSFSRWGRAFRENLAYFALTGLPSIANRWGIIALSLVSTPVNVAVYAAAEKLTTAVLNTVVPLNRVFLPKIIKESNKKDGIAKNISDILLLTSIIFYSFVSLFLVFVSPYIAHLFFKDPINDLFLIFACQFIYIPFMTFNRIISQTVYVAADDVRFCSNVNISSSAIYLTISYFVAADNGAIGVALTRLSCELIVMFILIARYVVFLRPSLGQREA